MRSAPRRLQEFVSAPECRDLRAPADERRGTTDRPERRILFGKWRTEPTTERDVEDGVLRRAARAGSPSMHFMATLDSSRTIDTEHPVRAASPGRTGGVRCGLYRSGRLRLSVGWRHAAR